MDELRESGSGSMPGSPPKQAPRFGSYIGLFYVAAILGILSFAVLRDTGTTHAFDRLRAGMTPTEVAALLGVPRSETNEGSKVVQAWRIPDGQTFEVEFQDGKLIQKRKSLDGRGR